MDTKKIIVAFQIGRGGRFNNGGHLSYICQQNISHFCNDLFWDQKEDCRSEDDYLNQELEDQSGNSVDLTVREMENGVGRINFDGEYDTIYTQYLDTLSECEKRAILNTAGFRGNDVETLFKNADKFMISTETSNGTKYVADDNSDVLNYQDARMFNSEEEAENYIDQNDWKDCSVLKVFDLI